MHLDRVTITGADDSVTPADLLKLSLEHPYVEYGLLVSAQHEGSPRFPTARWVMDLVQTDQPLRVSLHVCGRWARALLMGHRDLYLEWPVPAAVYWHFQRIQLNVRGPARHDARAAVELFTRRGGTHQVIVQMDGASNETILTELRECGLDAVPLYDASGGAGLVPREWPRATPFVPYQGYAGGLGPDTLERELPRIAEAETATYANTNRTEEQRIWIDMERRVRSEDDTRFDLDKGAAVLGDLRHDHQGGRACANAVMEQPTTASASQSSENSRSRRSASNTARRTARNRSPHRTRRALPSGESSSRQGARCGRRAGGCPDHRGERGGRVRIEREATGRA